MQQYIWEPAMGSLISANAKTMQLSQDYSFDRQTEKKM